MGGSPERVAVVTGGTSGIGEAIAGGLAQAGLRVVLLARDPKRAEATMARIGQRHPAAKTEWIRADLSSQGSIREAVAEFDHRHAQLHVLVGAAGVFHRTRSETPEGVESTFAVNYLSHFLLAKLLGPALERGAPSRVVLVASKYGRTAIDFDDLMVKRRKFTVLNSVAPTKLAEVLLAQELASRWAPKRITANAMHPGLVAHTQLLEEVGGMWKWMTNTFGSTPEKGADTAVWLATSAEAQQATGQFFAKRRPISAPGQGSDPSVRARLWAESERLVMPPA